LGKQVHVWWEIHGISILPAQDCKIHQEGRRFRVSSEVISLLLSSLISFLGAQNSPFRLNFNSSEIFRASTHEGACSRSTLLQHAPGAKLPRLHQRFLGKIYVAQQNFRSRVLHPLIKLVQYEEASSGGKSDARVCFRSKLPRVHWNLLAVTWRVPYFLSFHAPIGLFHQSAPSSCPSCVLVGALTRERVSGACFRSKLPCVYGPYYSGR